MKIILPLSITLPRKIKADKVFYLNLNIYRNSNHMTLNHAKIAWKEIVLRNEIILVEHPSPPLHFIYTIFPGSGRKFDLGNVCSIIQKFTDDALIEYGMISDDSYKIIPQVSYRIGHIDKENPRCELEIKTLRDIL